VADQWEQAAAALVDAAVPAHSRLPAAWPVCAVLLPHAQAVLDLTSGGLWRIAEYLGYSGSYLAARDLFQQIAHAYSEDDAYGPEHPETLAAHGDLAYWTGQAGDAAGARDQFAALLPVRERVSGPEHPHTLTDRGDLATWTGEAGDAAGARDQFAALLPVRERVLGPEHPQTLAARHELARWTGSAGDAAGARDQSAALLPIEEQVLGTEHPATLDTRGNLARWAGKAGDPAAARDQFDALLPVRERVLGSEHPDTLATRDNLAHWPGRAGDPAAARDQFDALLPVRERILGSDHPDTLATRHSLARWTGQAGDPAAARALAVALLPLYERVLGGQHPDTLATRLTLARWTGQAGDPAAARDLFAALLPVYERIVGAEHPSTLTARHRGYRPAAPRAPGARTAAPGRCGHRWRPRGGRRRPPPPAPRPRTRRPGRRGSRPPPGRGCGAADCGQATPRGPPAPPRPHPRPAAASSRRLPTFLHRQDPPPRCHPPRGDPPPSPDPRPARAQEWDGITGKRSRWHGVSFGCRGRRERLSRCLTLGLPVRIRGPMPSPGSRGNARRIVASSVAWPGLVGLPAGCRPLLGSAGPISRLVPPLPAANGVTTCDRPRNHPHEPAGPPGRRGGGRRLARTGWRGTRRARPAPVGRVPVARLPHGWPGCPVLAGWLGWPGSA
jgi:hypothetical protein